MSTICSMSTARVLGRIHRQQRADQLDEVRAGERGLVDMRRPCAPAARGPTRCAVPRGAHARFGVRGAVQSQTARIGAPLLFQFGPRHRFRLGRAGGLLRGSQLLRGRRTVDDDEVVARPFPQPRGAPRPRPDALLGDTGDLGHPGVLVDRNPLEAALGVQLVPQHGLIDDTGGLGFVVQRLGVDRHQRAVGAGLAVGHDHVGVQVRIPAPRRLVLIGDRPPAPAAAAGPSSRSPGCAPGCSRRAGAGSPSRRPRPGCGLRRRPCRRRRRSAPAAATRSSARRRSDRTRAPIPC